MPENEVTSTREAFERVHTHLTNDVGTILTLIEACRGSGAKPDFTPYWALMRMMFPVAESLGDLIYQTPNQTAQNLKKVLETQFQNVRGKYSGKAAILTQLFRHSLTHSDEPRTLMAGTKEVGWTVTYNSRGSHLDVTHPSPNIVLIQFDVTAFYDDLESVCLNAMDEETDPKIVSQYNSWLTLTLNPQKRTHEEAITEICAL